MDKATTFSERKFKIREYDPLRKSQKLFQDYFLVKVKTSVLHFVKYEGEWKTKLYNTFF